MANTKNVNKQIANHLTAIRKLLNNRKNNKSNNGHTMFYHKIMERTK